LLFFDGLRAGGMQRRLHHHFQGEKIPFFTRPGREKTLVVPDGSDLKLNPAAFSAGQAAAAAGHSGPLPGEAPAAAAASPVKARRESPGRAGRDDSEPGAAGHLPLPSMPDAFMATAPRPGWTRKETLTPRH
jgi:hypothetical protein